MENKKKGMIFGKINIIDLIIIIAVILVVIFLVMKFSDGGIVGEAAANDHVRITFYQEECANYIAEQTKIGDTVYDANAEYEFGVVTDFKVEKDSQTYVTTDDGELHLVPREGYCAVYITTETYGTLTPNGVVVGGETYGVGHTLVLRAGFGKYYLRVYSIEPID
ncbi:MAG: DUF4330 family protein [Oscillospiraceae bacterium]|nr:DUF4330 family protein [Oscillospiraceae bacterium]